MTWKVLKDPYDSSLTYIMIKTTIPYETGQWCRTLRAALESTMDMDREDDTTINILLESYEVIVSAATKGELKLLILLEE